MQISLIISGSRMTSSMMTGGPFRLEDDVRVMVLVDETVIVVE
jgi:hypothetical protein